jgi:hypothetical protein
MPIVDLARIRSDPNMSLSSFIGPWVLGYVVLTKALGMSYLYGQSVSAVIKLMVAVITANVLTSLLGGLNAAYTAANNITIYLFVGGPIYAAVGFWIGRRLKHLSQDQPAFFSGWHRFTQAILSRPWFWALLFPLIQAVSFVLFFYVLDYKGAGAHFEYLWFKWLAVLFSLGSGYLVTSLIEAELIWRAAKSWNLRSIVDGGHSRLMQSTFRINAFAITLVLLAAVALKV